MMPISCKALKISKDNGGWGLWIPHMGDHSSSGKCVDNRTNTTAYYHLAMGVRDIVRSRQLSSQLFFKKSCQGNCQVNCATEIFLKGNCQVIYFSNKFVKANVKSILWNNFFPRQLSIQLFVKNYFQIFLVNFD